MPLSPSQTRELLEELSHQPKKLLGQNFLIDGNIVRKSLEWGDVHASDTVVEIGPGLGTLSRALLETGCQLYAVEKDPGLAEHLRNSVAIDYPSFSLTEGDALDYPIGKISEKNIEQYKVIANLPYAISSPWLDAVLDQTFIPNDLVLLLQKETADRFAAEPNNGNFGPISIFLQSAYQVKAIHKVSRKCFYPVPKIDSALIHLQKVKTPFLFAPEKKKAIRQLFTQRRKQMGALLKKDPLFLAFRAHLEEQGIPLQNRPENISVSLWQSF